MEKIIQQILDIFEKDKAKIHDFLKDPKAMMEAHHIDFDPSKIKEIVEGVKDKIDLDSIAEKGTEIFEGIKHLFKK